MRRWVIIGIVAVLVVGGAVVYFASSGSSSSSKPLLITAVAQPRDLRDQVTVQGTLGRVEQSTINSVSQFSQVSKVFLKDGATLAAGEAILSLDGRSAVTTDGAFQYFRKLDVGAEGEDVAQLNATLRAAGYSPDGGRRYTEATRVALAQWQAAHGYPGAAPGVSQAVQVSLVQGAGYKLGDQTSAGLTIGPPPAARAAATTGKSSRVVKAVATNSDCPPNATTTTNATTLPEVCLTGTQTVQQGNSVRLTVTANPAPLQDTQVALTSGGTALPGTDYDAFPPTVTIPANQPSVQVTISTKTSTTVKPDKLLVVSLTPLSSGFYRVGPVSSATVTIAGTGGSAATPVVTIRASGLKVPAGTPATFTISLDRALSDPLQISLGYGGNAVAGSDYNPAGGVITVPPGQTALPVQVPTLDNGRVQKDPALFVTVQPDSTYTVGDPSTAAIVIVSATLPKISIIGGPAAVGQGGGALFTIVADQPPVKDISVQYTVTGTAQQGKDLQPVTGTVVLPAGETTAPIPILTLNTNVFFLPTDMIAGTWPTRLGQVFVKEGDLVPAGTPLFNLTETRFTVTLDATAADRTKLKVGQAVTVQLQGGTDTAPGVITQLDDNVTTDKTTKKTSYKGKVQVKGDLGAADGAPVTIKVVTQEQLGALTVPIAAVKQNGSGVDVVRVIDLANGGKVHEVKVVTGLSEGSYIQIKSGLTDKQVVIVQVDKSSG